MMIFVKLRFNEPMLTSVIIFGYMLIFISYLIGTQFMHVKNKCWRRELNPHECNLNGF